jgi:hypothetical protein
VNQVLVSATGGPELLRDICKAAVEVGGYRFAWVGFAEDNPEKAVRPVASAGFEKGYLESTSFTWDDGGWEEALSVKPFAWVRLMLSKIFLLT